MNQYQGILFDLDGTLLDTAKDLGAAANDALTAFGYPPISDEVAAQVASYGTTGLLQAGLGERYGRTDVTPLRQRLLDFYANHICQHTCLYPGVAALISRLEQAGIPWGIVTNKPGWLTDPLLEHFPELKSRMATISGDSVGVAKPDPKPMLAAAQLLALPAPQILYVGDAKRDIEAAQNSNMDSAVALWGYLLPTDRPQDWQATYLCQQVSDLDGLVLN
ncbi:HAD family hydrolase [Ferrimonas senticii]|uniref:HAD family hydrolase n=1 Tax=Ferrimonas senticii TaxID=394566 RepID=UPI000400D58E|nr:HAD-IA family hydrolase [Ferrimonas senticii]